MEMAGERQRQVGGGHGHPHPEWLLLHITRLCLKRERGREGSFLLRTSVFHTRALTDAQQHAQHRCQASHAKKQTDLMSSLREEETRVEEEVWGEGGQEMTQQEE